MDAVQRVLELEGRIESMSKCYLLGFHAKLMEVYQDCYLFQIISKSKYQEQALETLTQLNEAYNQFSFEGMTDNSDYAPLFVIRDLLIQFNSVVSDFFEQSNTENYKRIGDLKEVIAWVGEIYRAKLNGYIDELRSIEGYEKYQVPVNSLLENGYQYGL